jgi:hypothetical protein
VVTGELPASSCLAQSAEALNSALQELKKSMDPAEGTNKTASETLLERLIFRIMVNS